MPLNNSLTDWTKRLPNWLTFIRLALIPVFVSLLVDPTVWSLRAATVVFIVATITDYADGIIARRYSAVTDFGKLFDPLADKILVMAALVMLVSLRDDQFGLALGKDHFGESFVPAWIVVLVLAREIWVTGLRGLAASRGTIIAARGAGKVKSALQMVAIVFLLLHDLRFSLASWLITSQLAGLILISVSLIWSYVGAYEYTVAVLGAQAGAVIESSSVEE